MKASHPPVPIDPHCLVALKYLSFACMAGSPGSRLTAATTCISPRLRHAPYAIPCFTEDLRNGNMASTVGRYDAYLRHLLQPFPDTSWSQPCINAPRALS